MPAGSACTLFRTLGDGDGDADDVDAGILSIPGTCRSTFDGTGVACVPNPPPPPAALSQPCAGMDAGSTCQAKGPFGGGFQGSCVDPRGTGTLICFRVPTPPQPLVEACAGKATGDACEFGERRDGGTFTGVCANGPAGLGPLACKPAHVPADRLAAACEGIDAGSACMLGRWAWSIEGTCTSPAAGGAALCLPPCPSPGHRFHRIPREPHLPIPGLDGGW